MKVAFSRRSASPFVPIAALAVLVSGGATYAQTAPVTPAAAPVVQTAAGKAAKASRENYFGVYLKNTKVGSYYFVRDDKALLPGTDRPAVRIYGKTVLDMRIMGAPASQVIESTTWNEPKTGKPLKETTTTSSSGRINRVTATYSDTGVTYEADVQGEKKTGTLTLAPGEAFLADPQNGGGDYAPVVGTRIKGKIFVGDLLRLMDSEAVVDSEDTITVNNQAVRAFKVLDKNPVGPSTIYLNADGDILRVDTLLGMQIRKEPKETALAAPNTKMPPLDLASLVGITPTGNRLDNARKLQTATFRLSNVTRPLPPPDSVQTATYSLAAPNPPATGDRSAGQALTVTVTTQQVPKSGTAPLWTVPNDAPARLRPYLQSSVYVPTGDPEFAPLARKIIGQETETGKAAQKIAAYVHQTIVPDPAIPALRTARDILHTPRGVCRDYTTLFATLARSVGLPTKQCTGIVYANGTFLYHAWPEVWVGKNAQTGADQWVALEPTWGLPWADATHIKLAEGEITDVYQISADIGNYQITVLQTGEKPAGSQP